MKLVTKLGDIVVRTISLPVPYQCRAHICKGATHQTTIIGGANCGGVWRHHSEEDARGGHITAIELVKVVG